MLGDFHPAVRRWFERTYGSPTPPQTLGWPPISAGRNTLILAPTGSGKTLAAFLWAINHLVEQHLSGPLEPGIRILYVSPLKALNNDIERNLEAPLAGIREEAHRMHLQLPHLRSAVRTGDTPQSKRAAMLRHPPDILITTPESLYLMLTSKRARQLFRTVQYVIVDEIHSVCGNKRGVHLSMTLERLQMVAEQEIVRIGLSATQRPLDLIASYLGGLHRVDGDLLPREVTIVDAGQRKSMDLAVTCAVPDFSLLTAGSVWPLVFTEVLETIRKHRTTLIFVNNRRLAERMATKLNEMSSGELDDGFGSGHTFNMYAVPHGGTPVQAPPDDRPLVQAYHGSMSRTARERMEQELKEGRLRGLVATSSLELGIDIGSIDCVLQIQSPKGVARGLQRVGRSGHLVTAESKGRILPTHREDLMESSVAARAMLEGEVEPTTIPENCLDVLAQQIVAMVGIEEWNVDDLYNSIRQSYCYRALPESLYLGVLQMLAGRYAREAFRELRPRISWDRVNNTLRSLPGSVRLAITGGGTISDRGYFGVYLQDARTKVGEVDEEFVFETRIGDTFILGTSVWRVVEIDPNRLLVAPAPGHAARMPFWRGEGIGRSYELGKKVGEFRRMVSERVDSPDCLPWLLQSFPIDPRAAWNIQEYMRRQRAVVGVVPHDGLLLVEGFRDEIGDPRIVVHSAFGRRVNGLLALVLARRLQQLTGVEPQFLYNDDGVLLRCPDVTRLPLGLFEGFNAISARETILEDLLSSPLFGGQFRQNAARALMLPKGWGGRRMPLWLQRLRAADLLQIARQSSDFPIVIETIREVLHDILDFEHFTELAQAIESGRVSVQTVETDVPSPFSASLLFDFIAVYMYEWDQPRADRASQFLAVNRELLAEVIDLDSIPSLLKPEAIKDVERELQHAAASTQARSPEELMEILLRVGDLAEEELLERCEGDGRAMLDVLARDGRATRTVVGGNPRWIAGEEAELYADLADEARARSVVSRYLRSHGPVSTGEPTQRFGIAHDRAESLANSLQRGSHLVRGRFRPEGMPGAEEEQWCYRPNLERIHRRTIGILRKEITPSSLEEYSRFLLHWQRVHPAARAQSPESFPESITRLQGYPLPAEAIERDILRARAKGFDGTFHTDLTRRGELIWLGCGPGKMICTFRGEAGVFVRPPEAEGLSAEAGRVLTFLSKNGASFLADLRAGETLSLAALNAALAELFWNGFITNDLFPELSALKRSTKTPPEVPAERVTMLHPSHDPRRAGILRGVRRAIRQVPGWNGRWSVAGIAAVTGPSLSEEEQAARQAEQLLERYGIVAREFMTRELLLPWPVIAAEFQRLEMRGEIRRGYFVEGLSGMQYARHEAVDELRRLKSNPERSPAITLVNSCDPANVFGQGIGFPSSPAGTVRTHRIASTLVVFEEGTPILVIEGEGTRIWTIGRPTTESVTEGLRALVELTRLPSPLKPLREILVEHWDGERPGATSWAGVLRQLGFRGSANQTMRYDGYR